MHRGGYNPDRLLELSSGNPKSGDILKGDIWGIRARLMDFALKFALDTSILTALSKAIPEGERCLDALNFPSRQGKRRPDGTVRWKCHFEMSWFKM